MRLFEEMLSALGLAEDVAFGGAKVVLYAGRCAYFENVKGILSLGGEEVVLLLRKGKVRAEGKNLRLARYGGGDLPRHGSEKGDGDGIRAHRIR